MARAERQAEAAANAKPAERVSAERKKNLPYVLSVGRREWPQVSR